MLWQPEIIENTSGLLRQCFPKGADLSSITQIELDGVAEKLNTCPRKSLGWKYPAELFIPDTFIVFSSSTINLLHFKLEIAIY